MTDATVAVRPGDELDWAALERYLRGVLDLPAAAIEVRQFAAGRANLTYRVSFGSTHLVIRRPPHGALAPGSHDMAREHRVLSRLAPAYPRAPRSLHFCDDRSVVGAPFVVVEHREGVVVRDRVPRELAHHHDVERRIDAALLDAVADLHAVNSIEAGLGDLGRPEGFAERQLRGWHDRWRRAAATGQVLAMDQVAQRLAETVPVPQRTSIVHNDMKLDNCQFQRGDPDVVTSVFDRDMATQGDPLFDLGLLLESMRAQPAWVLGADEVAQRYAARTGLDVAELNWYVAFAAWRTAVVLQQLYNRFLAGDTTDERYATFGAAIPECAARARDLIR